MAIEVHPKPFKFANFIRVNEWPVGNTMDVGHLSPAEAAKYWDELKPLWIAHVAERHQRILRDCLSGNADAAQEKQP
jgi:hypothetical protein